MVITFIQEKQDKARIKAEEKINTEHKWAKTPCQPCMKAEVECKVGGSFGRCARCAGQGRRIADCGVDTFRFLLRKPTGCEKWSELFEISVSLLL